LAHRVVAPVADINEVGQTVGMSGLHIAETSFEDSGKQLRRGAAFAALAIALTLLTGCTRPTHDQSTLKAIKAESQILMLTEQPVTYGTVPKVIVTVPKSRWPRVIASLKPEWVTVFPDGVDIMIKPFFDGGWGYFVPRSEREPPEPAGRYSELGQGVYWYHPY
jgi:hypothetical protein